MSRFKVGEYVERVSTFAPESPKRGVALRVLPNKEGVEWFTEYEVQFAEHLVGKFYQTQLRPAKAESAQNSR